MSETRINTKGSILTVRGPQTADQLESGELLRHMAALVEELRCEGYQGASNDDDIVNASAALAIEIANGLPYADMNVMQQHEAWAKHLPTD